MVTYMNFIKNVFSKLVFELETSCKEQKNCKQYSNSMVPFPRYLTNFLSRDVVNVIFEKTSITFFIFLAKDFKKSKLKLFMASYRVTTILKSSHFCAQIGKNVFKYAYHGYKNIDILYLSNGGR